MRLGFDGTTLGDGMSGVGYYTARLLEGLAGLDALTRIDVLTNREPPPALLPQRCRVLRRRRLPVRSLWMQLALPAVLRELRPDLAHFTNYLAPLRAPVPYVVSIHDMSLALLPECHTFKKRLLTASLVPAVARRARLLLVPSESTRRDVVRLLRLDPGRLRVVPYAADERFHPVEGSPEPLARLGVRPPYVLCVGTLEPRKNLARTLRAFARAGLSDHQIVLAGARGWKYREVLREAERPELRGRAVLLGYLPERDLPLLYTHAAACVYASLYEGFGLPLVEAMACGAPVVTSNNSSLAELGEGAALLVDPRDERALAEAMVAAATEAPLRARLREAGLARAAGYSWARTARETLAAYRAALEG